MACETVGLASLARTLVLIRKLPCDERMRTEWTHEKFDLVVTGSAAFGGVEIDD